jgi:hypothetical protein
MISYFEVKLVKRYSRNSLPTVISWLGVPYHESDQQFLSKYFIVKAPPKARMILWLLFKVFWLQQLLKRMMIQILGKLQDWISIIKQVYPNKSSLLLNIDLQSTQTLQLNQNGNHLNWETKQRGLGLDRQSV